MIKYTTIRISGREAVNSVMNIVYFYAGEHERYPSYTRKSDDERTYFIRHWYTRWFCAPNLESCTRWAELRTTAIILDIAKRTEHWRVYEGGDQLKDDADVQCELVEIKTHLGEEAKGTAMLRAEVFRPSIIAHHEDDGCAEAVLLRSWSKRYGVQTVWKYVTWTMFVHF